VTFVTPPLGPTRTDSVLNQTLSKNASGDAIGFVGLAPPFVPEIRPMHRKVCADPLREGGRFHRWQRLSVLHQKPEALGIDRQAEVRALRLFAATAFQEVELLTRLNAIGGDAQAEPTAYTE